MNFTPPNWIVQPIVNSINSIKTFSIHTYFFSLLHSKSFIVSQLGKFVQFHIQTHWQKRIAHAYTGSAHTFALTLLIHPFLNTENANIFRLAWRKYCIRTQFLWKNFWCRYFDGSDERANAKERKHTTTSSCLSIDGSTETHRTLLFLLISRRNFLRVWISRVVTITSYVAALLHADVSSMNTAHRNKTHLDSLLL